MSSFMSRILYLTLIYNNLLTLFLLKNIIYLTNDLETYYQKYIKILAEY